MTNLVDMNDPATWESLYAIYTADGTRLAHYERAVKDLINGSNGSMFGEGDHFSLLKALDIQPNQSIVIIGAGFGWVAEDWIKAGYGPIVCVDNSTWIHANKKDNAVLEIIDADGADPTQVDKILAGLGKADWCISEDVLGLKSDADAKILSDNMKLIGNSIAHWCSPNLNTPLNTRSPEEWKEFLGDLIVRRGGEVIV